MSTFPVRGRGVPHPSQPGGPLAAAVCLLAVAALLGMPVPGVAGIFDTIDKVEKSVTNTEKKVDQTTRIKDSSKRITEKSGAPTRPRLDDEKHRLVSNMPASAARKKSRSRRVGLNQKRGRVSEAAPACRGRAIGTARGDAAQIGVEAACDLADVAADARGGQRIGTVEQHLELRAAAERVALEVVRDDHQRDSLPRSSSARPCS